MNSRTASRAAWVVWALTVVLIALWPFFAAAAGTQEAGILAYFTFPPAVLGFATIGAVITSKRPENRIGWIFALVSLSAAAGLFAGAYAKYSIDGPASFPLDWFAAWVGRATFPAIVGPIPLVFLVFPDGRVPGPRWRPVLWVMLGGLAVNAVSFAVTPGKLDCCFVETRRPVMNPFGFPVAWKNGVEAITTGAGFVVLVCAFLSVVALFLRFRRSSADERQQIRWLAYVAGAAASIPLLGIAVAVVRTLAGIHAGDKDPVGDILFIAFFYILILGIPAASGIAILRYRLYELDIVVKKTVVFAVLLLFTGIVYVFAVGVIGAIVSGQSTSAVSFAAGVVAALAFQPIRRLGRRLADRIVYGKRATPYEVLSEFSERVGTTYSTEDVLPRMAEILGAGTGASSAGIWLRIGDELRLAASWPRDGEPAQTRLRLVGDELPTFMDADHASPVRHQSELLGALTVAMPVSDPMNPARAKLAQDLAAQAGLVLRNVRLIEDLRESRRRIVAAQDERAKALERNIHDGAQQQLVSLAVKLRLAGQLTERDPPKATELLAQLQDETNDALENLRDLARGIYPPLLADKGLAAALEGQARKSAIPVTVDPDSVGRYPQEIEAAVYFCCLEALQNAAKYANASHVALRLSADDGQLRFVVKDDGVGFDPAMTPKGSGLQNMEDRLAALGGTLELQSAPGAGTTVIGRVPSRHAEALE